LVNGNHDCLYGTIGDESTQVQSFPLDSEKCNTKEARWWKEGNMWVNEVSTKDGNLCLYEDNTTTTISDKVRTYPKYFDHCKTTLARWDEEVQHPKQCEYKITNKISGDTLY